MAELPRPTYGPRPSHVRSAAQARAYDAGVRDGFRASMVMIGLVAPDDSAREAMTELCNRASRELADVIRAVHDG